MFLFLFFNQMQYEMYPKITFSIEISLFKCPNIFIIILNINSIKLIIK